MLQNLSNFGFDFETSMSLKVDDATCKDGEVDGCEPDDLLTPPRKKSDTDSECSHSVQCLDCSDLN